MKNIHFDEINNITKIDNVEFSNKKVTIKNNFLLNKNFQELNLDSIIDLENASEILKTAANQIKKGKSDIEHFGD